MEKVIRIRDVTGRTGLPAPAVRAAVANGTIRGVQLGGKGCAVWIPEGEVDKLNALLKGKQ